MSFFKKYFEGHPPLHVIRDRSNLNNQKMLLLVVGAKLINKIHNKETRGNKIRQRPNKQIGY